MEFEDVPETLLHDVIIELLKLVLKHRFHHQNILVASNMACRWDPKDARVGVDPDVIVVDPAPPEGQALKALRVWSPEHNPPKLAIEVVSETNAAKDYLEAPARLARLGAEELWIFDPELHGPTQTGGPFPLQIWRKTHNPTTMRCTHAGPTPGYSPALGAWAIITVDGHLRIADDANGDQIWLTRAEAAEAQAKEDREKAKEDREKAKEDREKAKEDRKRARAAEDRAKTAEAEIERLQALLKKQQT